MKRLPDTSLKGLNTFSVGAAAAAVVQLDAPSDLDGIEFDPGADLLLGGGSNLLLVDNVPGTAYLNRIRGRRVLEQDADSALVEAGGGEDWHGLVRWSLEQGLSGLENLSLIPGLAGAAPMQNIGAYGVELSSVLESLTAWDFEECRLRDLGNTECRFAYRDSRFKSEEPGRYLITAIRLRLRRHFTPQLDYAGLRDELSPLGEKQPTALQVSDAVTALRRRKLPDPVEIGNAGSFFKNPVVPTTQARELVSNHPRLPLYPESGGMTKLSAGWMIENCGWKGHREGDAGVSAMHALVLVNYGSATGREIHALSRRIHASVQHEFGIDLEIEPRIIQFHSN